MTGPEIGAAGFVGLAFEAVEGTYEAPTKFFPIKSESLQWGQATTMRRVIAGIADSRGAIPGELEVGGDIEMECLESVLPYFLYASRNSVVKGGVDPDFTYTTTPLHRARPTAGRTLSITIVKADEVFGWVGCIVHGLHFTVDAGVLNMTVNILGLDEEEEALPVPTFDNSVPFGAGQYNLQIPTATQVFDIAGFTLDIVDNGVHENRLKDTRSIAFNRFGEREVTLSLNRDFIDRTEYEAFKALTAQSVTLLATKGAANQVQFTIPRGIKTTYEIGNLSSQGDLIMAEMELAGDYDTATSKAYEILVKTQEDIS